MNWRILAPLGFVLASAVLTLPLSAPASAQTLGARGEYPPPASVQPAPAPATPQQPQAVGQGRTPYPPPGGVLTAPPATAAQQPAPAQGNRRSGQATDAFLGLTPQQFYDLDGRLARVEQRAQSLPADQRGSALKTLRSIRNEAQWRRKRKGGELKDWDLEHLQGQVNELVARYPALGQ